MSSPDVAVMDAPLTAQDRCDRCSAQAYLRATSGTSGLELLFCGHHFAAAELPEDWHVTDFRHLLVGSDA